MIRLIAVLGLVAAVVVTPMVLTDVAAAQKPSSQSHNSLHSAIR